MKEQKRARRHYKTKTPLAARAHKAYNSDAMQIDAVGRDAYPLNELAGDAPYQRTADCSSSKRDKTTNIPPGALADTVVVVHHAQQHDGVDGHGGWYRWRHGGRRQGRRHTREAKTNGRKGRLASPPGHRTVGNTSVLATEGRQRCDRGLASCGDEESGEMGGWSASEYASMSAAHQPRSLSSTRVDQVRNLDISICSNCSRLMRTELMPHDSGRSSTPAAVTCVL